MNKSILTLIVALFSLPAFCDYMPGELLVKFKKTTPLNVKKAFVNKATMTNKSTVTAFRALSSGKELVKIKLKKGTSLQKEMDKLSKDSSIEYVQPNYIYKSFAIPDDPQFSKLWGLKNISQIITNPTYATNNPGNSGMDIEMEEAWDIRTDCSSKTVAVIDTGINYNAHDLVANMWDGSGCIDHNGTALGSCQHGYNFVDDSKIPLDYNGHGTHVAGIIGAVGNNGIGASGICWKINIMAVKVLGVNGGTTEDIVKGIEFAWRNGADVINMSLGGNPEGPDLAYQNAMETAVNNDVFISSAAGNETSNNDEVNIVPCNIKGNGMVCVTAVDQKFQLADFSNYGVTKVELAAPGTNIYSTTHGTSSLIYIDDLSAGWNPAGKWEISELGACSIGSPVLFVIPSSFCDGGGYPSGLSGELQKNFGNLLSTHDSGYFDYKLQMDLDSTSYLTIGRNNSATINFSDPDQVVDHYTGSGTGYLKGDLSRCAGSNNCSIGAKLNTNASVTDYFGVAFSEIELTGITLYNDTYASYSGTSMASPHVAGLAALLMAENPDYTPSNIQEVLMNTGTKLASLSGMTTTESVISAGEAINFITTPVGLGVVQTNP